MIREALGRTLFPLLCPYAGTEVSDAIWNAPECFGYRRSSLRMADALIAGPFASILSEREALRTRAEEAEAQAEIAEQWLGAAEARIAQLEAALGIAAAFLDMSAGEGLVWVEQENGSPRMDAADLFYVMADRLGHEPGDPEMVAITSAGLVTIRALNPDGETSHG